MSLPEVATTGVDATLRPYQDEGFRWLAFLWESRLGGILADDMGLGKTLQTLALVAHARSSTDPAPFLVVAPTSVLSAHGPTRQPLFTPGLQGAHRDRVPGEAGVCRSRGCNEGADIVVTSYTLFRLEAAD